MLCAYCGKSEADMARIVGISRQSFNRRLQLNTISPDEMAKIAEALGAEYKVAFIFPDGNEVIMDK